MSLGQKKSLLKKILNLYSLKVRGSKSPLGCAYYIEIFTTIFPVKLKPQGWFNLTLK